MVLQQPLLETKTVFFFYSSYYPLLFLSLFFIRYKQKYPGLSFQSIEMPLLSLTQLQQQLETTFLGNPQLYWLKDLSKLEPSAQTEISHYLMSYKGPNKVVCFITNADYIDNKAATVRSMELPLAIPVHDISLLLEVIDMPLGTPIVERAIKKLEKITDTVSLDQASLFLHYTVLLGVNNDLFFNEWVHFILTPAVSLFMLSQHFFSKKELLFFGLWKSIHAQYNEAFWTVYWSEQIWRAGMYIALRKQGALSDAKKIAYKLPFSFINNDWRHYTVGECKNAHQFLYELDYNVKNGNSLLGLDLFYTSFFLNKFI